MPGYLTILRRHIVLVLLLAIAGLLAGAAAVAAHEPRYEAVADVQLEQVESPFRSSGGTRGDLTRAMQTQIDIATGDAVRAQVQAELGSVPPITVVPKGERDELEFRAVAETGERAAAIANAWADGYVAVLRADYEAEAQRYLQAFDAVYSRVYDQIADIDARAATATGPALAQLELEREVLVTQLKSLAGRRTPEGTSSAAQIVASPVRRAEVPTEPMSDIAARLLALGLVGGLVLGYLVACLKEARRDEVRSVEDVGLVAPGTAVLGPVPTTSADGVAALDDPALVAQFQLLRAEVSALSDSAEASSVLAVTSAVSEAPVGQVAAGLAVSLARAGRRVVLIDADVHAPRQHALFSTPSEPGLANVLDGGLPVDAALVPVPLAAGAALWLLPAGDGGRDECLAHPSFQTLVSSLLADPEFDTVLIAAPQVLGTSGALAVAELASSVLVVAAPRRTRRRDLGAALRRLALAAPAVSAVVLATSSEGSRRRRGNAEHSPRSLEAPASARTVSAADRPARETVARTDAEPLDTAGRRR